MELAVRRMIESRVDGVAILTFGMEDYLLEHLRFRNLPLVFVDIGPKAPRVSNIRVDYADGIRQVCGCAQRCLRNIDARNWLAGEARLCRRGGS